MHGVAGGYTGLILSAGRGSRLGTITEEMPKCFIELDGRTLIDWQVSALQEGGAESVFAVTGYLHTMIEQTGIETIYNPDWENTNMVGSLLCAIERLSPPFIVSYSDIVYQSKVVKQLVTSSGEITITYDTDWLNLWQRRFADPLSDAETFRIDDQGCIIEIGGRANSIAEIQGQFMGLFKLSKNAVNWIVGLIDDNPEFRASLDTTKLLGHLIQAGKPVYGVPTAGGWCEIDDEDDMEVAKELLAEGHLFSTGNEKGSKLW